MFHVPDSAEDLLTQWRWLVGVGARLHGWSAAAVLFFTDDRGSVHRLDTSSGQIDIVADSMESFESMLAKVEEADQLLLLPIVAAEQVHGSLEEGQCIGFKTLPVFGGSYGVGNRFALSVTEHAAFTGDVHRQIRDLPDGAQIVLKPVP
jgi:hypothetical protein